MEECIFCKIIKGEIPCYRVFENEKVLAFLDINPVIEGHTLIIPKKHCKDIFEIEEEYLFEVAKAAKEISSRMEKSIGAEGIDIFQANRIQGEQTVFHYHMHIIPRREGDGISFSSEMMRNVKKISPNRFEKIRGFLEAV
jgi:histidine triad (HIT) family protein